MPEPRASTNAPDAAARRRAVLRTVWIVAGIALLVYVAFVLSGVLQS